MAKKEKQAKKDILQEVFKEGATKYVPKSKDERMTIEEELAKREIPYHAWDCPIVENGKVRGYEITIFLDEPLPREEATDSAEEAKE